MAFHPLYENYHAFKLALISDIYLSPDGAFLSLSRGRIHRGRRTKKVSRVAAVEMKALSGDMSVEKIAELYDLPVESICKQIKAIEKSPEAL